MQRKENLSSMLRQRAVLMHNVDSDTINELGQTEIVPAEKANFPVAVIPQTGSLLQGRAADTTLSRTTHKVICRYRTDVMPEDWLMIGHTRYEILYAMDPYLNHERLEIFCEVII